MNYIDLFCGAGGLSIGLAKAGFDLEMSLDIAKPALDTFKENVKHLHSEVYRNRIFCEDIIDLDKSLWGENALNINFSKDSNHYETKASIRLKKQKKGDQIEKIKERISEIKSLDMLAGGPPCQGFSTAGRSKKKHLVNSEESFIDDPRNQLFKYFLNFAKHLDPKVILIENVQGLKSAKTYHDDIIEAVSKTGKGYNVQSIDINCADFGIPQNRKRIFFFAFRNDLKIDFEEFKQKLFSQKKNNFITVKEAIYDLPPIKANPEINNYSEKNEISYTSSDCFGKNISDLNYSDLVKEQSSFVKRINTFKGKIIEPKYLLNHKTRYNNENDIEIYSRLSPGKNLNDPSNQNALDLVTYGKVKTSDGQKIKSFADKYFKLDPNKPSRTILAHLETDGNGFVHPRDEKRSISPREAARIQTFPDWYFFTGTLRNQFKQIGNAVPPLLAEIIGNTIKDYLIEKKN